MTFGSKHPPAVLLLDIALSISLFVVAAIFADGMHRAATPTYKWMYAIWFAIGGLPCLLYLRHRGVVRFDRGDVVAFSPMALVLGIVPKLFGHPYDIIAIVLLLQVCYWIRELLPPIRLHGTVSDSNNVP